MENGFVSWFLVRFTISVKASFRGKENTIPWLTKPARRVALCPVGDEGGADLCDPGKCVGHTHGSSNQETSIMAIAR